MANYSSLAGMDLELSERSLKLAVTLGGAGSPHKL